MKMNRIFYLMGKSSSGKDTLYQKIRESMPKLAAIVGYTTRPARENEKDGREYFFVDIEKMKEMEKQGLIIEERTYHTIHGDWHYFTADDGQVEQENQDFILIGTLQSFEKVRGYYGKERVIPIYIEVEDGVRLKRALEREKKQKLPNYAELCRRYLADEEDFKEESIMRCQIDRRFVNDDMEKCLDEILNYIRGFTHQGE